MIWALAPQTPVENVAQSPLRLLNLTLVESTRRTQSRIFLRSPPKAGRQTLPLGAKHSRSTAPTSRSCNRQDDKACRRGSSGWLQSREARAPRKTVRTTSQSGADGSSSPDRPNRRCAGPQGDRTSPTEFASEGHEKRSPAAARR